MSNCATPQTPSQEEFGAPSLTGFAQAVLEHVITSVGHTEIRAGVDNENQFVISVKDYKWVGKDQYEVTQRFLTWLATCNRKFDPAATVGALAALDLKEEKETTELITLLARGGMSDHGKKVERMRQERGTVLYQTLLSLHKEGYKPESFTHFLEEVQKRSEYQDLEAAELLQAVNDFTALANAKPDHAG